MAKYSNNSPYRDTLFTQNYLGPMVNRPIPKEADDQVLRIPKVFEFRPDLLAHHLYGDSNLWWVFAQRNPNTLQNPLLDFKEGVEIYLPKIGTLKTALGT